MSTLVDKQMQKSFIRTLDSAPLGRLTLVQPDGSVTRLGQQAANSNAPEASLTVRDWRFLGPVLARGDIGFAETYIAGFWHTDSIEQLISFFLYNIDHFDQYAHGNLFQRMVFRAINSFVRRNSRKGSRGNIKAHYDVGNDFYALWLDPTMTYSSALYKNGADDLEGAQHAKYGRIIDLMDKAHGDVLEIGCGWGGFAADAVAKGLDVTGITVSSAQHTYASQRLGSKAAIKLQDYRDTSGTFNNIVSIEMFEAVGEKYWPDYFGVLKQRLARSGKAVVQTITIADHLFDDYRVRSDFIRHYIFPGGMLPSVARFRQAAAAAGLSCAEPFRFGHDYARTLREWLQRFEAAGPQMEKMGHGQRMQRSWRFYLAMCAAAFAVNRTDVVQFELTHAQ